MNSPLFQVVKIVITAVLIWLISVMSRRFTTLGAIFASLPITSLLAIIWIYLDTQNSRLILKLSSSILLLIIPSMLFFVVLIILLKFNWNFWLSIGISSLSTFFGYVLFVKVINELAIVFK